MKSIICAVLLATTVVKQKGKAFSPSALTIKAGDTIEFENDDTITHNVFAKSEAAVFDLKQQAPGAKSAATFARPGVVEVRCAIHPGMKLVVTIQ